MKILVINNMCLKGKKRYFNYVVKRLRKIYHNLIVVDFISFNNIDKNRINILIIAGGDGSINRIINETINYDIIYGIIPLGTANDFSHFLKIRNVDEAIDIIRKQNVKYKNINKVNNDYFLYALSYGTVNNFIYISKGKKFLFKYAYVLNCLGINKFEEENIKIIYKNNEETIKAKCIIVTNSKYLGGFKINLLRTQKYHMFIIRRLTDLIKIFTFSRKNLIELNSNDVMRIKGENHDFCLDGEKYMGSDLTIKFGKKRIKMII